MLTELIRRALPSHWRYAVKLLKTKPSFAEDGLLCWHNADFLRDDRFKRAYELGKGTGSWHGAEIRWRAFVICWAANQAVKLPGDFVECGVNKGGFGRAVVDYVDFSKLPKNYWLVDTFRGLPERFKANAGPIPPYQECYEEVRTTFGPFPNVKLVRGIVPDVLPQVAAEKIAFLSIDMNSVEPERASLEYFWGKLVPGAMIVLDDYGFFGYERQKLSADEFVAGKGQMVLMLPTGQGLILKL